MINTDELISGLKRLNGIDIENAERKVRREGEVVLNVTYSKAFQSELAAKALGKNVKTLKNMKANEYDIMCNEVLSFLTIPSPETPADITENSASDLENSEVLTSGTAKQPKK